MHGVPYLEHLSYLGIFLAMATSGYVVPLPEEAILLGAGFLIAQGVVNPWFTLLAGILGAITGDTFLYTLCHHGSRFAERLKGRVEHSHARWYEKWLESNTGLAVFCMRFIPGMRFLSPVIAGIARVKWRTFFTWNCLAAITFVPIVMGLGYIFSDNIRYALRTALVVRHAVVEVVVWVVGIFVFLWFMDWLFKRVS